ncbi:MAG: hypothetical protein AAF702_15735 [Chloroflexota bacterium]
MAFTNFKSIADVQSTYDIRHLWADFIRKVPIEPSASLIEDIQFKYDNIDIFASETARKENIIYPILLSIYRNYHNKLSIWSEYYIYADDALCGHPDYLLSARSALGTTIMSTPILTVMEAKENNFKSGWGQCLAAMVAAQRLNAATIDKETIIYGLVTDGELWQFGKLERQIFTQSQPSYTLSDLADMYKAVGWLYAEAERQI